MLSVLGLYAVGQALDAGVLAPKMVDILWAKLRQGKNVGIFATELRFSDDNLARFDLYCSRGSGPREGSPHAEDVAVSIGQESRFPKRTCRQTVCTMDVRRERSVYA